MASLKPTASLDWELFRVPAAVFQHLQRHKLKGIRAAGVQGYLKNGKTPS